MKLIMENWREYVKYIDQQDTLEEDMAEYIPGTSAHKMRKAVGDPGPIEAIKAGFGKLISKPEEFDRLVAMTKEQFKIIFMDRLELLLQSKEMKQAGAEIADQINQNTDKAPGGEEFTDSSTKQFSLEDLARMGVSQEVIELVAHSLSTNGAEALIEAAEEVIGKPAPLKIKDWLVRFVSKFIGSFVFGFIDNFIMVLAGSQIDAAMGGVAGAMVGTANASMMAAGLGNTVSDAVGEWASSSIEGALDKLGLDPEAVTDDQVAAGPAWMRFLDKQASIFGIILGCLVGLFPLFLEEEKKENNI